MTDRRFDKFTKRARMVVLQYALEEARSFNHSYVGTEHILLGLIRESESISARVLADLGIKLERARNAVELLVGRGEAPHPTNPEFTTRANKVIACALEEAKSLNHHYIGSEHLLLGLVRNGAGVAAGVLDLMGVPLDQVRSQVLRVMRHGIGAGPAQTSSTSNPPAALAPHLAAPQSTTPHLDAFSTDLTALAKANGLEPTLGRDHEIRRLLHILSQRLRRSPIVVGKAGVGKTMVLRGLAWQVAHGPVPDNIRLRRVVELDIQRLLLTNGAAQLTALVKGLLEEARAPEVVLIVSDLHQLFGGLDSPAHRAIGEALGQALAANSIQLIGETTPDKYQRYIAQNAFLSRWTQPVLISPLQEEQVIAIVGGQKHTFEDYYQLFITREAIAAAAAVAEANASGEFFLQDALDLIDQAASRVRLDGLTTPPELFELLREFEGLRSQYEAAQKAGQAELAASLLAREQELRDSIALYDAFSPTEGSPNSLYVTEADVDLVVRERSGLSSLAWEQPVEHATAAREATSPAAPPADAPPPTHQQIQQLHRALLQAFPTAEALEQMVYLGTGENLNAVAGDGNLEQRVLELLRWAAAQNRLRELVGGARRRNPGNKALRVAAEALMTP